MFVDHELRSLALLARGFEGRLQSGTLEALVFGVGFSAEGVDVLLDAHGVRGLAEVHFSAWWFEERVLAMHDGTLGADCLFEVVEAAANLCKEPVHVH